MKQIKLNKLGYLGWAILLISWSVISPAIPLTFGDEAGQSYIILGYALLFALLCALKDKFALKDKLMYLMFFAHFLMGLAMTYLMFMLYILGFFIYFTALAFTLRACLGFANPKIMD